MARIRLTMLALAVCVLATAAVTAPADGFRPLAPSVVVIMTDDQTYEDMVAMPMTRRLIGEAGATFTRAYVSYPLCCPSRATFLTGLYAHNHGVRSTSPPEGGFEALDADHTLATWLRDAGYHTAHIGKYLNGYGMRRPPDVPPGWAEWRGAVDKSTYQMYGYTLYENGELMTYGDYFREDPAVYQTDVFAAKAVDSIRNQSSTDPLFLSLNFVAPHGESTFPGASTSPAIRPAPRHVGRFAGLRLPRAGEHDMSDKPVHLRDLPRLGPESIERIAENFRSRRESLLAVDEAVASVIASLADSGRLDSTYVIFTSDNGFLQGEHRIPKGKYFPYEASSHVPLLIRGPGIAPGTVSDELVSNADLAPTILEATGAQADRSMDGRSLLPFARDAGLRSTRPVLHEGLVGGDADRDGAPARRTRLGTYFAIRTDRYLYVMWRGGGRELYDLARDPEERRSMHADPRYAPVRASLTATLRRLRRCSGAGCNEPLTPPAMPARRARR